MNKNTLCSHQRVNYNLREKRWKKVRVIWKQFWGQELLPESCLDVLYFHIYTKSCENNKIEQKHIMFTPTSHYNPKAKESERGSRGNKTGDLAPILRTLSSFLKLVRMDCKQIMFKSTISLKSKSKSGERKRGGSDCKDESTFIFIQNHL